MKKQTQKAYPSSETAIDLSLDTVSDTELETELQKVKIRRKLPPTLSTNGAHKMSHYISSNGAEKESEHHSENHSSPNEQHIYRFGKHVIDISKISYEDIITEDDEPVDNFPSEKQQRLLVNPLYNASDLKKPFVAAANVGIHYLPNRPAIVPDMFLSLNASTGDGKDIWDKENRTYYVWKKGKGPEVVLEIVSNNKGNESGSKFQTYATLGARYYVVLDHLRQVQDEILKVYELVDGSYEERDDYLLPEVNLSLTFWDGTFEDLYWSWLRWCDLGGTMIPIEEERVSHEKERADTAVSVAEQERERADKALSEAELAKVQIEQERVRAEQVQALADQEKERADKALSEAELAKVQIEQERVRAEQVQALADQAMSEAEQAKIQIKQERERAELERQEKERLYALLREAGIDAGI